MDLRNESRTDIIIIIILTYLIYIVDHVEVVFDNFFVMKYSMKLYMKSVQFNQVFPTTGHPHVKNPTHVKIKIQKPTLV